MKKKEILEIEWPWEMVCFDYINSNRIQGYSGDCRNDQAR